MYAESPVKINQLTLKLYCSPIIRQALKAQAGLTEVYSMSLVLPLKKYKAASSKCMEREQRIHLKIQNEDFRTQSGATELPEVLT